MSLDFGVSAAVLRQSLQARAPSRAKPDPHRAPNGLRLSDPPSRRTKNLLRAKSALAKDAPALEQLDRMLASEKFENMPAASQQHLLAHTFSVTRKDEGYIDDIFRLVDSPAIGWPEASFRPLADQLARHAESPRARESLLAFSQLDVASVLNPVIRNNLIAYLGGPSEGRTSSNQASLQTWWDRRRLDLLDVLTPMSEQDGHAGEDTIAYFLGLPSRPFTLMYNERLRGGFGIAFGDPGKSSEYAYFVAVTLDRAQRKQIRLHATHPLDRRVTKDQTFYGMQTELSRREEYALISWMQENHWIGIDWLPEDGEDMPPGVLKNMHRLLTSVRQTATTFASPRGALEFAAVRLRNGRTLGEVAQDDVGLEALMSELAA